MIKLIPEQTNFNAECCSCMRTGNCYKLVIKTVYGVIPNIVYVCKNCLQELQKQIEEQGKDATE